jgi:hypothetical protein
LAISAGKLLATLDADSLLAPIRMRQLRDFGSFPTEQTQVRYCYCYCCCCYCYCRCCCEFSLCNRRLQIKALSSKLAGFEQLMGDALQHVRRRADFLLRGRIKADLTTWYDDRIRSDLALQFSYK